MNSGQMALRFDPPRRPVRTAFFNTTAMNGEALKQATHDAHHQDVLVLAIFQGTKRPMTPSEVWTQGRDCGTGWLLTSVRRSVNTLTRQALLAAGSTHVRPDPVAMARGMEDAVAANRAQREAAEQRRPGETRAQQNERNGWLEVDWAHVQRAMRLPEVMARKGK